VDVPWLPKYVPDNPALELESMWMFDAREKGFPHVGFPSDVRVAGRLRDRAGPGAGRSCVRRPTPAFAPGRRSRHRRNGAQENAARADGLFVPPASVAWRDLVPSAPISCARHCRRN